MNLCLTYDIDLRWPWCLHIWVFNYARSQHVEFCQEGRGQGEGNRHGWMNVPRQDCKDVHMPSIFMHVYKARSNTLKFHSTVYENAQKFKKSKILKIQNFRRKGSTHPTSTPRLLWRIVPLRNEILATPLFVRKHVYWTRTPWAMCQWCISCASFMSLWSWLLPTSCQKWPTKLSCHGNMCIKFKLSSIFYSWKY